MNDGPQGIRDDNVRRRFWVYLVKSVIHSFSLF
jgi:hypothetical protein